MTYTTHGYMTPTDMRDYRELYDWDLHRGGEGMHIELDITNIYEGGDEIKTKFEGDIPEPPTLDEENGRYDDWAYDHIYDKTGTERPEGDAAYFVTVVDCSEPAMIGREFEWGV